LFIKEELTLVYCGVAVIQAATKVMMKKRKVSHDINKHLNSFVAAGMTSVR
jgi:hypothetical protein